MSAAAGTLAARHSTCARPSKCWRRAKLFHARSSAAAAIAGARGRNARHDSPPHRRCFAAASPLLRPRFDARASAAPWSADAARRESRRRNPACKSGLRAAGAAGLRAAGAPGVSPPGESRIQAASLKLQTLGSACCILTTLSLQLHTPQNTDHPSESKNLGLQHRSAGCHIWYLPPTQQLRVLRQSSRTVPSWRRAKGIPTRHQTS